MAKNGMRPVHPGEILRKEYLAELGLSANALAKALNVAAPRINDIVRERRGITADTAPRLARYFDTTPQFSDGLCPAAGGGCRGPAGSSVRWQR